MDEDSDKEDALEKPPLTNDSTRVILADRNGNDKKKMASKKRKLANSTGDSQVQ